MSLRARHGKSALYGVGPVVETPPADELTNADVAAPVPAPSEPIARRPDGKVDGTEAARALGKRGGLKRKENRARAQAFGTRLRLAVDIPLYESSAHAAPFADEAEAFFQAKLAELARDSDGIVSAGVSAVVRGAAWQIYSGRMLFELATSRGFLFTKVDERVVPNVSLLQQASAITAAGRQALLTSHHLQQLEAAARAKSSEGSADPVALMRARLLGDGA